METSLSYLLCAEKVIRDETSKKFTYIDVFSKVFFPSNSEKITHFFFVVGRVLSVKAGAIHVIILIKHSDGSIIASEDLSGNIQDGDLEISAFFKLVEINKPGRYFLKAVVNGVELSDEAKFYFDVEQQ